VPYTGGNGGTYSAQTIPSTGVIGLTATLAAGTLLSGAGSLTYTITGTPASSGTASFALGTGGQACTLTRTVELPVGSITALSCSTATNNGILTQGIAAASVSSSVPYTGDNGGTYTAQNIISTGVTGLTAALAAGTFTDGVGSLTYTITGTPATSGTASFALNIGGQTCTLARTVLTNLPSLSTTSITSITNTTAISGGNIISDGGSTIAVRGVCWSTSQNPTIALTTKTTNGTGTGNFISNLASLSPNTMYYVRAYATNSIGTAYGTEVSFTTAPTTLTDVDGNVYNTVTIGNQVWMKENLKVTKYRDGTIIPTGYDNTTWQNTTSGAYAIYNNDAANNVTYGKLYNWYAVVNPRELCPAGWHVPYDSEWQTLITFLGGYSVAGGKMKKNGTQNWSSPNTNATNESGFTGLGAGYRSNVGTFTNIGLYGVWWHYSTWINPNYFYLRNDSGNAFISNNLNKGNGLSVRCIRD
jgi:uncharacterized protein (TIGR02145 family)